MAPLHPSLTVLMLSKIMYAWSIRRAQGEEANGTMHFIHNKRLLAHEQTVTLDEHHEGRDYPLHNHTQSMKRIILQEEKLKNNSTKVRLILVKTITPFS